VFRVLERTVRDPLEILIECGVLAGFHHFESRPLCGAPLPHLLRSLADRRLHGSRVSVARRREAARPIAAAAGWAIAPTLTKRRGLFSFEAVVYSLLPVSGKRERHVDKGRKELEEQLHCRTLMEAGVLCVPETPKLAPPPDAKQSSIYDKISR
jgi:hypothetical protein